LRKLSSYGLDYKGIWETNFKDKSSQRKLTDFISSPAMAQVKAAAAAEHKRLKRERVELFKAKIEEEKATVQVVTNTQPAEEASSFFLAKPLANGQALLPSIQFAPSPPIIITFKDSYSVFNDNFHGMGSRKINWGY